MFLKYLCEFLGTMMLILLGDGVDRLSRLAEDGRVLGDEIGALHASESGEAADQEGVLHALEGLHGLEALGDACW